MVRGPLRWDEEGGAVVARVDRIDAVAQKLTGLPGSAPRRGSTAMSRIHESSAGGRSWNQKFVAEKERAKRHGMSTKYWRKFGALITRSLGRRRRMRSTRACMS